MILYIAGVSLASEQYVEAKPSSSDRLKGWIWGSCCNWITHFIQGWILSYPRKDTQLVVKEKRISHLFWLIVACLHVHSPDDRGRPSGEWHRGSWLHRRERAACQAPSKDWDPPSLWPPFQPLDKELHPPRNRPLSCLLLQVPTNLQIILLICCSSAFSTSACLREQGQILMCGFWSLLTWHKPAMMVAFSPCSQHIHTQDTPGFQFLKLPVGCWTHQPPSCFHYTDDISSSSLRTYIQALH